MKNRLAKLAALTRGATVITLSAGASAGCGCTKNDTSSAAPVAAAAAASTTPAPGPDETTASDSPDAGADGGVGWIRHRRFPTPNALPPDRLRKIKEADGGS